MNYYYAMTPEDTAYLYAHPELWEAHPNGMVKNWALGNRRIDGLYDVVGGFYGDLDHGTFIPPEVHMAKSMGEFFHLIGFGHLYDHIPQGRII